jgi:hypothetical protein
MVIELNHTLVTTSVVCSCTHTYCRLSLLCEKKWILKYRFCMLNLSGVTQSLSNFCLYIQVSQEECARLREGGPYGKVYRYNPKHLCPKLNGYGDNGQSKVWYSGGSTHCTCRLSSLTNVCPWVWCGVLSVPSSHVSCIVLGTLMTTMTYVRVFFCSSI